MKHLWFVYYSTMKFLCPKGGFKISGFIAMKKWVRDIEYVKNRKEEII